MEGNYGKVLQSGGGLSLRLARDSELVSGASE
jgi:hypothetical protein